MNPRSLTKSRFKLAMECPTKLYYTGKKEYANQNIDDPFLLALADGGFQVGELAKCYFPGGYEVETLDYQEALNQTNALLQQENVVIYEAAIQFQNLFIRVDVLRKVGDRIDLFEVKAKSFDPGNEAFFNKSGKPSSNWKPYLLDIAFQKYVTCGAFPDLKVKSYLMLADKTALTPTDGLNQKFRFHTVGKRKRVVVSPFLTPQDLDPPILTAVNVDYYCQSIWDDVYDLRGTEVTFAELVEILASHYEQDRQIAPLPSKDCGSCEFYTTPENEKAGLRSGFKECWKQALGWQDKDFGEPTVLDIWNYRSKDKLIAKGALKFSHLEPGDFKAEPDGKPGISPGQRQWMQVEKVQNNDPTCYIDRESLRREMEQWEFPLHFIDFETAAVAIPFNKGRRPYEAIAFQFSHHTVDANGVVAHKGEYLNVTPGVFPNYDFLRALKRELDQDQGTVFRYAAHENSYLNFIYQQICQETQPIPDKEELLEFIRSITHSSGASPGEWKGERDMVDLCELVKRYYYDPAMGGSNSIKKVLPAILNASQFLHEKYSKPIYGASDGIPSRNYKDWTWIHWEEGKVKDPYSLLPKLFTDIDERNNEILLSDSDEIKEGGAAMTAYARLQFEDMSDYERQAICKGLLKYCELDTFAMVLIYEAWREMVGK